MILYALTILLVISRVEDGVFSGYKIPRKCSIGLLDGQDPICIDKDIRNGVFQLTCIVNELSGNIDFKYPNETLGFAFCAAQTSFRKNTGPDCHCKCKATPTCECSITQDIDQRSATLVIRDAELTSMVGIYTCKHGSYSKSIELNYCDMIQDIEGKDFSTDVHLSGEVTEMKEYSNFKLTCFSCWVPYTESVNFFVNGVLEDSVRHSGGKCYQKRKSCSPADCTCSKEGNSFTWSFISYLSYAEFSCEMRFKDEINSKLSIRTAILVFNESEFKQENNKARTITALERSQYNGNDYPDENRTKPANCQRNGKTAYVVVCTLMMAVAIGIFILSCFFPDILGRLKRSICRCVFRIQNPTGNNCFTNKLMCSSCKEPSVCGICVDCNNRYNCGTCCKIHLIKNSNHRMCQIQNVTNSQREIICKRCKRIAKTFCGICWELSCSKCETTHIHGENKPMKIYKAPLESGKKISEDSLDTLYFCGSYSIEFDNYPVRICGIGYLETGTLVAVDRNNQNLIIFKSQKCQMKKKLGEEPCAMTTMIGNKIAVTFPYVMKVKIYEINLETTESIGNNLKHKEQIDFYSYGCNLKPFSIAYHNKYFAVEVGEGEDGAFMIIIDNKEKTLLSLIPCKFAYFTGHTIRLALNMKNTYTNDGRLFVSAMGKKTVTCINLEGEVLWQTSISSPRSLIVLNDHSFDVHIMLSSRRLNAIYELTKKSETNSEERESLKVKYKASSPRYMAYDKKEKRLSVLVENEISKYDELAFFKFNDCEPNEETNLVDIEV